MKLNLIHFLSTLIQCKKFSSLSLFQIPSLIKEKEECDSDLISIICLVDPGQYRPLDELIRTETCGKGRLELIDLKEVNDNEEELGET